MSPKQKPAPKGLRDVVDGYPDVNLRCRYPGHLIDEEPTEVVERTIDRRAVVVVTWNCQCGGVRPDIFDARTGERLANSGRWNYSGTDNYVIKGHGRVDRGLFRLQTAARRLPTRK